MRCQYVDMTWRTELGEQIKKARLAADLTLEELASQVSVSRVQLGNYEKGKSAPPVNIVTEIASALKVEFEVSGYRITSVASPQLVRPVPQQLSLALDTDHKFASASLRVTPSMEENGLVVNLRLSDRLLS